MLNEIKNWLDDLAHKVLPQALLGQAIHLLRTALWRPPWDFALSCIRIQVGPVREEVQRWLDSEIARGHLAVAETVVTDHGRRGAPLCLERTELDWLGYRPQWAGLYALGRGVNPPHRRDDHTEYRYRLCSLSDTRGFAEAVRTPRTPATADSAT